MIEARKHQAVNVAEGQSLRGFRVVTNLADRGNSGIFFLPDLTINALRDEIVALVARRRVPAIYSETFFVKLGGLAFYGPDRMRDQFTVAEKKILTKFVAWSRRVNVYGEPTNPVLLLTSHELTMDYHLSSTWRAAHDGANGATRPCTHKPSPCHSLLARRSVPHGLSKRGLALESFELAAHARRHRLQVDGQFLELASELERHPVVIVLDDRCAGVGAYVERLVERESGTNRLRDSTLCDALAVDQ
jgi:hypothetical protein